MQVQVMLVTLLNCTDNVQFLLLYCFPRAFKITSHVGNFSAHFKFTVKLHPRTVWFNWHRHSSLDVSSKNEINKSQILVNKQCRTASSYESLTSHCSLDVKISPCWCTQFERYYTGLCKNTSCSLVWKYTLFVIYTYINCNSKPNHDLLEHRSRNSACVFEFSIFTIIWQHDVEDGKSAKSPPLLMPTSFVTSDLEQMNWSKLAYIFPVVVHYCLWNMIITITICYGIEKNLPRIIYWVATHNAKHL